jgi:hypothetical protein
MMAAGCIANPNKDPRLVNRQLNEAEIDQPVDFLESLTNGVSFTEPTLPRPNSHLTRRLCDCLKRFPTLILRLEIIGQCLSALRQLIKTLRILRLVKSRIT